MGSTACVSAVGCPCQAACVRRKRVTAVRPRPLQVAKKTVQVLVVGNPCNTNALICMENAPSIPRKNFHALTRLDENRAKAQLAMRAQRHYNSGEWRGAAAGWGASQARLPPSWGAGGR